MNEDISLISMHPFVRRFVINIVKSIQIKQYGHVRKIQPEEVKESRSVIDADLVPRVSNKVMQASMGENKINNMHTGIMEQAPKVVIRKRDMSPLIAPIKRSVPNRKIFQIVPPKTTIVPQRVSPQNKINPIVITKQALSPNMSTPKGEVLLNQDYGKIMPLLNDPSVSTIECSGPNKPLFVIRAGEKQITKITLDVLEIKNLLEKFADAAHIPLFEGVFRVTVDGMAVSAVISDMLESKFIIRKATPYNLLE